MALSNQLQNKYTHLLIMSLLSIYSINSKASSEPNETIIETKLVNILPKKSYSIDTATERTPRIPSSYEIMFVDEVQKNGFDNNQRIIELVEEAVSNKDARMTTIKAGMIATGTKYEYNFDQAAHYYKKGIELGDNDAQLGYAIFLLKNNGDIDEINKSLNEFYNTHKEKRVEFIIGKAYYENGYTNDSLPWLARSAESGSDRAQFLLYEIYNNSNENKNIADKWLVKSANNGNIKALNELRIKIESNQIKTANKSLSLAIIDNLIDGNDVPKSYKRTLNKVEENKITLDEVMKIK